jgi:hypothetical protein
MMITLLSLLVLFTPVQDQVTSVPSVSTPPVEVLGVEVRLYELTVRNVRAPRETSPPSGPLSNTDVIGVREASPARRDQPSIESRSRELARVGNGTGTGTGSQPVFIRSSGGYRYEYRVQVKNVSPKKIKSILWEYQLTDSSGTTIISQRLFLCRKTVKPAKVELLRAGTPAPPNRVVNADTSDEQSQKQRAVINRVEYSDGSTWIRDGWKPEKLTDDAAARAKDLRDGLCTPL